MNTSINTSLNTELSTDEKSNISRNAASETSPTQKALLAVKAMRGKLEQWQGHKTEALAIVGMACRLPGGVNSPEDFWDLLVNKEDAITDIPHDRWNPGEHYHADPAEPGKMYIKQGGFVDDVYQFDGELFGLSKRECTSMDPQQRLLLELSWEALERAGIAPRKSESRKNTGLFIGMATNDYSRFHMHSNNLEDIDIYSFTGSAPSIASGRISQLLDLGGPALSVDTACSSSIVALHLARQSILNDECETALVGGINLMLSPENSIYFCKTSALSTDNRCKTFDEKANGYVRSEGGGILVIKRLSKAIEDGDNIHALLLGSAINHDGEGIGLTAPNGESQQRLIEKALKNSGVKLEDVSYIETHGTGTPLGDPIELQALGRVFATRKNPIAIGSCKSNIGHTEAAAGIAGIIKTVLCLQHKKLAPNLHFDQPSSFIPWDKLPLRVVNHLEDWLAVNGKRIAGVSSFGFSGTNSHAILGEALPAPLTHHEAQQLTQKNNANDIFSHKLLTLSGKTQARLEATIKQTLDFVQAQNELPLDAVCSSINKSRYPFKHRIAVEFSSTVELEQALLAATQGDFSRIKSGDLPAGVELAPLALALGHPLPLMDKLFDHLVDHLPAFKNAYQACLTGFGQRGILVKKISTSNMPDGSGADETKENTLVDSHANGALYLQEYQNYPHLFCAYYAWIVCLADLFGDFDYISADTISALAAATYAGELSLSESIDICSAFVSGKNLPLSPAHHSDNVKTLCLIQGKAPVEIRSFDYWYGVLTASTGQGPDFIDFSSGNPITLINCSVLKAHSSKTRVISLADWIKQPQNLMTHLTGSMFVYGYDANWSSFYWGKNLSHTRVPVSPFERKFYRLSNPSLTKHEPKGDECNSTAIDHPIQKHANQKHTAENYPLMAKRIFSPQFNARVFQQILKPDQVTFLQDHGFLNHVVVPATAYLEIITSSLRAAGQQETFHLEDIVYHAGLYLSDDDSLVIQLVIAAGENVIQLFSATEKQLAINPDNAWTLHCTATLANNEPSRDKHLSIEPLLASVNSAQVTEAFYQNLNRYGYLFGPAHQGLSHIVALGEDTRVALVKAAPSIEAEFDRYYFHPAHLDSCCHAILDLIEQKNDEFIFITVGKDQAHFFRPAEKTVLVKAALVEKTEFSIKANMEIYNLRGDCLARVVGYTMKRVARAALIPEETGSLAPLSAKTTKNHGLPANLNTWLYSSTWKSIESDRNTIAAQNSGQWIITGAESVKNSASVKAIHELIRSANNAGTKFLAVDELGNFFTQEDFAHSPISGIIYLADEYTRLKPTNANAGVDATNHYLDLCQVINGIPKQDKALRVFAVTKGAVSVDNSDTCINLLTAPLWGLGRSLVLERPDLHFVNIDLDPAVPMAINAALLDAFSGTIAGEDQLAIRGDKVFVNRLINVTEKPASDNTHTPLLIPIGDNFKLAVDEQGSIENLYYREQARELLDEQEIEIEVSAAALNFYDVVTALDLIDTSLVNGKENDECRFGLDAVGRVTQLGSQVTDYKIGDWVIAFAPGCLAKYVKVHQHCITPKPAHFSINESATLPTAFLTAWYALVCLANIKKGDKVLIHAAAGGVGIAAINLARILGAEVYATASKPKWPLLRSLGVKHIYDSRTLDFANEVLLDTHGEGMDIILNSFIGDYIPKNIEALKAGGRFVEIGEREILTPEQVKSFAKPFSYFPFTLFEISRDHPEQIKSMFDEMAPLWNSPSFSGIPFQQFQAEDIKQAFRIMQQGLHQGKLIISLPDHKTSAELDINNCATVLITGGMGGIGWAAAQWLAGHEVKNIYLMGRSRLSPEIEEKIHLLKKSGARIEYLCGDISQAADVEHALKIIAANGDSLEGILHAAGVMKNALVADETRENALAVLSAKTSGSWNLHQASLHLPLKFFSCFSSMTSLVGAAGAASYAAGNAFVDAMVRYRKQQGLPAQAINWGAWEDVGMLTRLNESAQEYWRDNGMKALPSNLALEIFSHLAQKNYANVAVLPANWSLWTRQYESLPSVLKDIHKISGPGNQLGSETSNQIISSAVSVSGTHAEPTKSTVDIEHLVQASLRKVMRLEPGHAFSESSSFRELGVDSLMSVELRNMLSKALGKKLSSTLLFNYPHMGALIDYLKSEYRGDVCQAPSSPKVIQENKSSSPGMSLDTKALLIDQLKTLLRLPQETQLDELMPFKNMDIDSLMSVELRNILSKKLGVKLSSTLLFNYTTIAALAAHLETLVNPQKETVTLSAVQPELTPRASQADIDLARIRALLDEKLLELEN